jgi:hypothetical protein
MHSGVLEGQQWRHLGTKGQGRRRSVGHAWWAAIPNRCRYISEAINDFIQTKLQTKLAPTRENTPTQICLE